MCRCNRCAIHTVEPYVEPLTDEEKKHPVFSAIHGLENIPLRLKREYMQMFDRNVDAIEERENELWKKEVERIIGAKK